MLLRLLPFLSWPLWLLCLLLWLPVLLRLPWLLLQIWVPFIIALFAGVVHAAVPVERVCTLAFAAATSCTHSVKVVAFSAAAAVSLTAILRASTSAAV